MVLDRLQSQTLHEAHLVVLLKTNFNISFLVRLGLVRGYILHQNQKHRRFDFMII